MGAMGGRKAFDATAMMRKSERRRGAEEEQTAARRAGQGVADVMRYRQAGKRQRPEDGSSVRRSPKVKPRPGIGWRGATWEGGGQP